MKTRGQANKKKEPEVEPDPKVEQRTVIDENCDISALEAPTFTTLDRGPPAPMLQLDWDHPVSLIGEKVPSPRIHICEICDKPILIYGRMLPCKHVFCLTCARDETCCSNCGEQVARVEQTGLGTVYMCCFGVAGNPCKRTYLSQRDLQAHVDHRHVKPKDDPKDRACFRDPRASEPPPVRKESFSFHPGIPPPSFSGMPPTIPYPPPFFQPPPQ